MEHDAIPSEIRENRGARARRIATRVADTTVSVVAGTDAVVREAGLTTRSGRVSKRKLAMAALRPRSSGGRLIRAAATEIDRRRNPSSASRPGDSAAPPGTDGATTAR